MSVHLSTLARLCCGFCVARPSLLQKLLVQHRINLTGTDDEALRRRAYIVKRKARDECQIVTGRWLQYLNIMGANDFNGFHEVIETMLGSLESDFVAQLNIAQRTEKSVTMTGQSDISEFAGQSRF